MRSSPPSAPAAFFLIPSNMSRACAVRHGGSAGARGGGKQNELETKMGRGNPCNIRSTHRRRVVPSLSAAGSSWRARRLSHRRCGGVRRRGSRTAGWRKKSDRDEETQRELLVFLVQYKIDAHNTHAHSSL